MAIRINKTAYNGEKLTYGVITKISIDSETLMATLELTGYKSEEDRFSGSKGYAVLKHSFKLPEPAPENLTEYAYTTMSQVHTDMDFTEI